jgi:hypothetical protein
MSYSREDDPEVAIAFREALEDLQKNDQYAIDNLTVIAKESTEHAQALCRELETHIKKVSERSEWEMGTNYIKNPMLISSSDPARIQTSSPVSSRLPRQARWHSIYRLP